MSKPVLPINFDHTLGVPKLEIQCLRLHKPIRFYAPVKIDPITFEPVKAKDGNFIYALPGGGSIR